MARRWSLALPLIFACFSIYSSGQNWNGVLAPNRAVDWTNAGATITNRTAICSTLNPGATGAQITTAVTNCSNSGGGVVYLNAGSYSVTSITMTSNVTLRGAGPQGAGNGGTDVKFTAGTGCGGNGGNLCVWNGDSNWGATEGDNSTSWTAGYSAGSTSITLSGHSNLNVGQILFLDQLNDSSDTGNVWNCGTTACTQQGETNGRNGNRGEVQPVLVTGCGTSTSGAACTSNTVTISPGIYPPNYRSSQSPGAWWSSTMPVVNVGVENLTLDFRGTATNGGGVMFDSAYNSWIKNVRSLNCSAQYDSGCSGNVHKHVWIFMSAHITVRDSYFYGADGTSESYGVDSAMSADNLVENNIFQHISNPNMTEEDMGTVFGYNYSVDHFYNNGDAAWQQDSASNHDCCAYFTMWEGNIGDGMKADNIHGGSSFYTNFRNRWSGRDLVSKTEETIPVEMMSNMRYYNLVGNILGTTGYHTNYQVTPSSTTDAGNSSTSDVSIYSIGYSGNEGTHFSGINNDTIELSTTMRWGNYDTVTGAARWCRSGSSSPCTADETGSGAPAYPGLASPHQTLPASFYRNAKPSWWLFPSGTANTPWPGIGPDITGGNIPNVGGYAYLNPAGNCYVNVMGGLTDVSSGMLTFNPSNCYGSGSGTSSGPTPPTGLSATVQ